MDKEPVSIALYRQAIHNLNRGKDMSGRPLFRPETNEEKMRRLIDRRLQLRSELAEIDQEIGKLDIQISKHGEIQR